MACARARSVCVGAGNAHRERRVQVDPCTVASCISHQHSKQLLTSRRMSSSKLIPAATGSACITAR